MNWQQLRGMLNAGACSLTKSQAGRNVFFLGLSQAINFLQPLIIVPYLVHTLGLEKFGLLAFAMAIATYLNNITDFGFNYNATGKVSVNRHDKKMLGRLFSSVMLVKAGLFAISAGAFLLVVFSFERFREELPLYLSTLLLVFGKMLVPSWLFQGLEKMQIISLYNLFSKILLTVLLLLLINQKADYVWVHAIYGLTDITVAIGAVVFLFSRSLITWSQASLQEIKNLLQTGWGIFAGNFSSTIYSNIHIIILESFVSPVALGAFSVAEKVVTIAKQVAIVLMNGVYPAACRIYAEGIEVLKDKLLKLMLFITLLFTAIGLALFAGAVPLASLLADSGIPQIAGYLQLLAFVPLINALNIPAYIMLLLADLRKAYLPTLLLGTVVAVSFNFLLVPVYGAKGTVFSILITEAFITLTFYLLLKLEYRPLNFLNFKYARFR